MPPQLVKLIFKFNRLSERERLSILGTAIFLLFAIWYFLIYGMQQYNLLQISSNVANERMELDKAAAKRTGIENLLKNNNVTKLQAKYFSLQKDMENLQKQTTNFQGRYIDDHDLGKLLYSILQQTSDVSIVDFANSTPPNGETASNQVTPSQTTLSTHTKNSIKPVNTPNMPIQNMNKSYYVLKLKGNYFSIMKYLQLLEASKWALYWSEIDYTVTKYPEALVAITFYTLKLNASVPAGGQ